MRSDNITGISDKVLEAIKRANDGNALAYSEDQLSNRSKQKFREIFEKEDIISHNLVSGTATNTLILSTLCPTYGVTFCHEHSHVYSDECGGFEFQTGGAKLHPICGQNGKLTPTALEDAIGRYIVDEPHHNQPAALTIANSTEAGTVYMPDEIEALSKVIKKHKLKLHMDGARFANALDIVGCSPAELTWKVGVDALSFGTTKNGTMGAEAAIFFNQSDDQGFVYRSMRSGHLISKSRFIAAQILAYLEDDHWLNNAKHANKMAFKLARAIEKSEAIEFKYPQQSNVMFVKMKQELHDEFESAGIEYFSSSEGSYVEARMVTAFNTTNSDIDRIIEIIEKY